MVCERANMQCVNGAVWHVHVCVHVTHMSVVCGACKHVHTPHVAGSVWRVPACAHTCSV